MRQSSGAGLRRAAQHADHSEWNGFRFHFYECQKWEHISKWCLCSSSLALWLHQFTHWGWVLSRVALHVNSNVWLTFSYMTTALVNSAQSCTCVLCMQIPVPWTPGLDFKITFRIFFITCLEILTCPALSSTSHLCCTTHLPSLLTCIS